MTEPIPMITEPSCPHVRCDVEGRAYLTAESLPILIAELRKVQEFTPELVAMLGYIDDDGDVKALTKQDLLDSL